MKKIVFSLICCAMLTSARALTTEEQLATIQETIDWILTEVSSGRYDFIFEIPQFAEWLAEQEYVTLPVWGPFEEFLTGQFQEYIYYPITGSLANIETLQYIIAEQLAGMNAEGIAEGFGVRVLSQDFTALETYLENAVSSPLNYIYTQLQNGINVHGTVSTDFNFDYRKWDDVFSYYAAATGPSRFNLAYHKRYDWASHIYDPKKPITEVVSVSQHGGESYDFLGFIEQYCNGQLQNMEQLQAGLVQVVGALRGDDAKTEEITDEFESVQDDATSQLSELRKSIDFSKYNFEVSDELFRSEVFAIGNGSSQLPEFVEIGPFDFRMFGPEVSSLGFSIDCREWRSFFELCRSCFTIIIYLVICTLALSICFLLWKVGAPCVRVLQNIFNF